jgi:hypothetical protein
MTEPAAPAPQPQPAAPFSEAEDKQYATLATFLNIILLIPALIFYFAFKDRGPRIADGLPIEALEQNGRSAVAALIAEGLVDGRTAIDGRVALTRRGRLLADAVVRRLT